MSKIHILFNIPKPEAPKLTLPGLVAGNLPRMARIASITRSFVRKLLFPFRMSGADMAMRRQQLLPALVTLLCMVVSIGVASSQTTRSYKIFGPKYQAVATTGRELSGAVYFLKSGHGGPDPGATGKYGLNILCEDEYAYDVVLRLGRNLIAKGATVYFITRDPNDGIRDDQILKPDKDEVCYPDLTIPLNQVQRLRQRTDAINRLSGANKGKFQRMISVHVDARSKNKNIDVFFYHDARSKTGKKAAMIMKNTFEEKYRANQPGRGYHGTVSDRDLYVVANSLPVSLYVELGNIHHFRDQRRIMNTDNRQALANWMTEALIKDYKTNK